MPLDLADEIRPGKRHACCAQGGVVQLDRDLVDTAEALRRRFPGSEGIAAAMYTADGDVLTGVFFEPEWARSTQAAGSSLILGKSTGIASATLT